MRQYIVAVMAAGICAAGLTSASAGLTVTQSFGSVPVGSYSGTGIPVDTSVKTTVTGIPGPTVFSPSDSLTLALSTTAHGAFNPAPGNDGVSTFTVGTGLVSGRSTWNYDYYFSSANGDLSGYSFLVTILNVGNGESFSYNPLLVGDNVGGPSSAGNSESLDFISSFIGYNPNLNDTYDVSLSASIGNNAPFARTSEQIIAGTGAPAPVPEASTLMSGALVLLPFGIGTLRSFRRKAASAPTA